MVYVAPDAQRTDAVQTSRNIEIGGEAHIKAQPQLEIYADDVKCSHGATVGQLDSEAILYMRQRGLSLEQAKRLQIEGFISDIVYQSKEFGEVLAQELTSKLELL
jgi:Fe-S cluster assembly protein SufD